MKKSLPIFVILALVAIAVVMFLQKSQVPTENPKQEAPVESNIKKVDLATQPEWIQKLKVTAKKGTSSNSLSNFTLTVDGVSSEAKSLTYVIEYQTTNKGVQGALGMSPQTIKGTTFTKTIDLGTCSTKSCVRHDGVTSVNIELDFSPSGIWTGLVSL
jgi:hypothetical protein